MKSAGQTINRIFVLGLLMTIELAGCIKTDKLITAAANLDAFHISSTVPNLEAVFIEHSRSKRSASMDVNYQFKAIDKDVNTYLNPNDGVLVGEETPVWVAEHNSDKVVYRRLGRGIMKRVIEEYQSRHPGHDESVFRASDDRSMEVDAFAEDSRTTQMPEHTADTMDDSFHRSSDPIEVSYTTLAKQIDETKQQKINDDKKIVFPTILVTTDFDITMETKDDSEYYEQIIYQLAFWNAVDLKFRNATNPKVRLRIAGFVIGSTRDATPYLNQHTVKGKIEIYPAMDDMLLYWHNMTSGGRFSQSYHMRSLSMFGRNLKGEETQYAGMASNSILYLCDKLAEAHIRYPMLIFNDDWSFGGINTAVHELAHALGLRHDLHMPGCDANDGSLMAPTTRVTINNPKWSKCSLEKLSGLLRGSVVGNCMDAPNNENPPGKPLGKILPGTLRGAEEQCQARGFDYACETTPGICRRLRCWNSGLKGFFTTFWSCQDSRSAAEGTECASGRVCLDGECRHLYPPETEQKSLNQLKKSLMVTDFKSGSARVFVPGLRRFEADIE